MPGYDGRGPMGQGPMTGGGRGYCVSPVARPAGGRYFGRGPGRGRRNMFYATGLTGGQRPGHGYPVYGRGAYPYSADVSAEEEKNILKNEAESLKVELEDIQKRLADLEKEA